MSTNATDDAAGRALERAQDDRYGELNIGDEEFVIYDRENNQAWIQSTVAVAIDDNR